MSCRALLLVLALCAAPSMSEDAPPQQALASAASGVSLIRGQVPQLKVTEVSKALLQEDEEEADTEQENEEEAEDEHEEAGREDVAQNMNALIRKQKAALDAQTQAVVKAMKEQTAQTQAMAGVTKNLVKVMKDAFLYKGEESDSILQKALLFKGPDENHHSYLAATNHHLYHMVNPHSHDADAGDDADHNHDEEGLSPVAHRHEPLEAYVV